MIYLHLINDEKFTDFTISLFEEFNPGKNRFFVSVNNHKAQPIYTKISDKPTFFTTGSKEYYRAIKKAEFDVLVIHYLDYFKSRAVLKTSKKKIIVWLSWGADIYSTEFFKGSLYQERTLKLISDLHTPANKLKDYFRNLYYLLFLKIPPTTAFRKAVAKVDFCSTVISQEFTILQSWPFFKARQVPFSYASIENDFQINNIKENKIDGCGILVGNSISPTSNHLDVFEKLKRLNVEDRPIIVPLNYGLEIDYRNEIVQSGRKLFGPEFTPLINFIPKNEYIRILTTCNIAILNHDRQQGLGNVILLLWLGCKLFLSEISVVFLHLKSLGFHIFSFQSELDKLSIACPLTIDHIIHNRHLLLKEYGKENVNKKINSLLSIVSDTHPKNN